MSKALALCISLILLATMLEAPALIAAAENDPPSELAGSDTLVIAAPEAVIDKTEVIYGRLDAKGAAGNLHVVNHFSVPKAGLITDYGAYDEIVWLTGREPRKDRDEIKIEAEAGNYYYEGVLKNKDLPWEFQIEWYLDGKQVEPASLSGANGDLEITLTSRANPSHQDLTEHYALQISFSLPRDRVTSIEAESATIAEAGNNTMVNYVVLPGFDADLSVRAKVKDFCMPGISIAAVKLDISFEMPDVSDINDDISKLVDAIAELKDGTDELETGSGDLNSGLSEIVSGTNTLGTEGQKLTDGISDAADGVADYTDGISSYINGVNQYLSGVNDYTKGVSDLATGAAKLDAGAGELVQGLNQLAGQNQNLTDGSQQILEALQQISDQLTLDGLAAPTAEDLARLDQLVQGSAAVKQGLDAFLAAFQGDGTAANPGLIAGLKGISTGLGQIKTALDAAIPAKVEVPQKIEGRDAWVVYLNNAGAAQGVNFEAFLDPTKPETWVLIGVLDKIMGELVKAAEMSNQSIGLLSNLSTEIGKLKAGQDQIIDGLEEAIGKDKNSGLQALVANYTQIDQGINELVGQIKGLSANLGSFPKLVAGLKQLSDQYSAFHAGLSQYTGGVQQIAQGVASKDPKQPGLKTGLSQLVGGLKQLDTGGKELRQGGDKLKTAGTRIKKGSTELVSGLKELKRGTAEYIDGVRKLGDGLREYQDGLTEYTDGISELASGVNELADGTKDMDEKMLDEINNKIDELLHKDFVPVSFVSPLNTNVKSVQFVLLTDEIPAPAKPVIEVPKEEDKGFLERVKDIFR
ncbi:MAG: hypothetical protein ACOYEL_03135 [Saccharofermentanales bacterium]